MSLLVIGILGCLAGVLLAFRYSQRRNTEIRARLKRQRGSIPIRGAWRKAA